MTHGILDHPALMVSGVLPKPCGTLILSFACRTGAHLCLGQYLAKMEMRIRFEELLPRLKSLALDGEAKMSQATFVNGPKALPIRFELN
jgi:cytochrome P450